MVKEVIRKSNINLTCPAKPGASLAFLGKNMAKFAREFNEKAKDKNDKYVKVEVKILRNGNYEFKIKNPPLAHKLLNRPDNYEQLSKEEKKKVREKERKEINSGEFQALVQEISPFLNTTDFEKAQKIVAGVARSVGVKIK